jgi:hypothetical protein
LEQIAAAKGEEAIQRSRGSAMSKPAVPKTWAEKCGLKTVQLGAGGAWNV